MSSVRAHPRRFRWLPHAAVLSQSARPTALESLQFTNLPHAPCFVRGGLGARRSLSQAPPSPARVAAICRSLCSPHRVVTGSGWPWPAPESRQEAPEPAPPKAGFNHTTAPAPQMPHPRGGPGRCERPRESESCESCRVSPAQRLPTVVSTRAHNPSARRSIPPAHTAQLRQQRAPGAPGSGNQGDRASGPHRTPAHVRPLRHGPT